VMTMDKLERIQTALGPVNNVALKLLFGYLNTQSIFAATYLGIFDQLADGPKSLDYLAQEIIKCNPPCEVEKVRLCRFLRYLHSIQVVEELENGIWRATPLSMCFTTDSPYSLRATALNFGFDQFYPLGLLHQTILTGESAYEKWYGEGQFARHLKDRKVGEIFDEAMTSLGYGSHKAIAEDYDYSNYSRVVDIGGGHGTLLKRIMFQNPHIYGVSLDQPHVINRSKTILEEWYHTEEGRVQCKANPNLKNIRFVAADFFHSDDYLNLPESHLSTVYIMKHIVHDWSDEAVVKIFKNLHDSIITNYQPNNKIPISHLLVIERLMIPRTSLIKGQGTAASDLIMLATFGEGMERSSDHLRDLLKRGGFQLERVIATRSPLYILDAVPIFPEHGINSNPSQNDIPK